MAAMEMMRKDPNYTFCMECSLHAMEFLEAHPELRDEVIQRMKEGRLEFGATYNQPYESWLSGEELVRETYFGRRWIKKNLPGCDAKVAFNPDPPARALQMQQILSKAGISYMFISRYHEGLYRWQSPDGSSILAYTPGHYGQHLPLLNGTPANGIAGIDNKLAQQAPYYEKYRIPPVYCLFNSMDCTRPVDFTPLVKAWNARGKPPVMRYSSIVGFFEQLDKPSARFQTLMGERPDVWAYITGPTHHRTASVKREAARLLPAAEIFTTLACMLDGGFRDWPTRALNQAWMDEIYIDHGIGGTNGHITDEVFHRKVESARDTGRLLLDQALARIAVRVKPASGVGKPVTVFNTLSWVRTAPVEVNADGLVHIVDAGGREVPCQWTSHGVSNEINVAATGKAAASSTFNAEYAAEKAVDGCWAVSDPNPETGPSSKWVSGGGAGPHWLVVDFGQARAIHKVVIRHEGVLGQNGNETRFNTADFQLQGADRSDGPWTDLVPPVIGNTAALTTHKFAPKSVRCLRVLITKGAQADALARIQEVQAFAPTTPAKRLVFVARDVPALGYKTYYLAAGAPAPAAAGTPLENGYYRITLAPGGIKSIFDKSQNRELLDTGKFLGGEVFAMLSVAPDNRGVGTDAGEFATIPLPVMDGSFERVATHRPEWQPIENGPVRSIYQLEQALADATVRQRLVVWHGIRQLDCEVDLAGFSGKLWREFRMALPLAVRQPALAYEVPMGVVEIGKDEIPTTGGAAYGSLNYSQQCRDIHPRLMQNFVDASDAVGGLTMSSSVSMFDWVDPTADAPDMTLLQPVLLASRVSCNGGGNYYPQAGDHAYRFALTSHDGGWRNGWHDGISANHPLLPVMVQPAPDASLPVEKCLVSLSVPNALISTIKKCEDDDGMVVRLCEMEGRDTQAALNLFMPVRKASLTNLIEEGGKPLPLKAGQVQIQLGHHAIETLKLEP
ncbi:MAG: discoidin domain-containing protein, partial [Verrucomicrobia bacterium]|nr:discoidin domain-containing protein [Verrucomicrobiota bacterium]